MHHHINPEKMREQLLERRRSLALRRRDNHHESRETDIDTYGHDEADRVVHDTDKARAAQLSSTELEELREIDDALERLDDGTYGECMECEEEIDRRRLHALPHTRLCIHCAEQRERSYYNTAAYPPTL